MKKLLFIILILLSTSHCFSQQLEIISVKAKPMDLYGRVNEKLDLNGNKCAVIKVQVDDDIIEISGMIGNVISQGIEKSIYVTQETKKIKIKFAKHLPITIDPKEYGIDKLIGGCTYEIYLKSEEEKQMYTVEKSTGIIPEWINDVKEGQFVGISMPNNNVAAAKKQALAMATLQYVIYNGGAKMKTIIDSQFNYEAKSNKTEEFQDYKGNTSYGSSAEYSNFAVNLAREYYNINGEYFVLCDYLKDEKNRNTIKIKTFSNYQRNALVKGSEKGVSGHYLNRNIISDIDFWINGVRCNLTSTYNYADNKHEDTTRIDGEIVFNKGYKYPNIKIFTGLKEHTFFERLDLASNSIGFSQLCFVMSIPFITNNLYLKKYNDMLIESNLDGFYMKKSIVVCRISNKDTLSVPIKIKWGGIRNNQIYYSFFSRHNSLEQDLTNNICQYSLDSNIPSLIMSKHFSFIEAMENLCLSLVDSTKAPKVIPTINNNEDYDTKSEPKFFSKRINKEEFDFYLRNIHLFPLFTSNDKKFNTKFNGVIVCSNNKLPFDFNQISNESRESKREMKEIITDSFSPVNAFSTSTLTTDTYSNLKPTGFAHQNLIIDGIALALFRGSKQVIELFGANLKDNIILSCFWINNKE